MSDELKLSPFTQALIEIYTKRKPAASSGVQNIRVSRTVSAAAFLLEKIRNSIEFRDDHTMLRAAIERIIRRRLLFNATGEGVGAYLVRELIWAKYLPSGSIPETRVAEVQESIDKYLLLRQQLLPHTKGSKQVFFSSWFLEVAACEIEERLHAAIERDAFTNFMYQLTIATITIDHKTDQERDIQVYLSVSRAFAKADVPLLRYQLLKLYIPDIERKDPSIVPKLLPRMEEIIRSIEAQLTNPIGGRLFRYARRTVAPLFILKDLFDQNRENLVDTLSTAEKRKEAIWHICAKRYSETGKKLRQLAIRSVIYIFLTKMVFALLFEIPLERFFQGKVDTIPLTINIVFPPILMFLLAFTVSPPGAANTKRIFGRIEEIIHHTPADNERKLDFSSQPVALRPILTFFFTLLYIGAFLFSFGAISYGLSLMHFSIVSQLIFIFFLSVITFFASRIRQTAREYLYEEREGIFSPIIDFFTLPILQVGQWLSNEVAKLNFFTYIFDFFLEIPLKGILEIFEEWFSFIRTKKEEIT